MTKAKVIMYKKSYCPYCAWAKNLLNKKNVQFEEIDITYDVNLQEYVKEKSGRMTVPQIFINDIPIGGYDDLCELDNKGELDKLLEVEYKKNG
ncbi:MAG: glutaredoxin 3 [Candidatus Sericytochromatia bacterium]|nr:MAG: glutaredoxin 3 [Candidatus Sericytochromatia bacterium]